MTKRNKPTAQTRNNWLIDTAVFSGALLSMLSGIYFLYAPSGGASSGGRGGSGYIFTRATWEDFHVWGGLLMITAVVVHLTVHWRWISMTTRRLWQKTCGQACRISRGAWVNIIVDGLIALSFIVTAVSGLYFYFFTEGGYQGGSNPNWDPGIWFSRPVWDVLHTWSGVLLTAMAVIHITIHWRWIVNVTRKQFRAWSPVEAKAS
ncbi:MAG: DUF4405 domain-containing protein [Anaerolineales bacterium]|nr:DUF4405 domain-containing protein [Anaerolineales bacterium]